jgi:hypothetical protein
MALEQNPKRSLSEIGHLFLSSVRARQTNGARPPCRRPPGADPRLSIDMTPEEFAQSCARAAAAREPEHADATGENMFPTGDPPSDTPSITALIASHLGARQAQCVRDYAGHLAADGRRVGLMELDAGEMHLSVFDAEDDEELGEDIAFAPDDPHSVADAVNELNCDVDAWLLVATSSKVPEARALLCDVEHWTLLSTCDHDGVVSCYRTLKGLADLPHQALSLAVIDPASDDQADQVFRKLSSVCLQFLNWPIDAEPAVVPAPQIREHRVTRWRPASAVASAPWKIASDFAARARQASAEGRGLPQPDVELHVTPESVASSSPAVSPIESDTTAAMPPESHQEPTMPVQQEAAMPAMTPVADAFKFPLPRRSSSIAHTPTEVIDLPEGEANSGAVVGAILRHSSGQLVECPVPVGQCPDGRLAITRDHRIVLLAVAHEGLSDLPAIARAYTWLLENRALIAMAMPQLAIDTTQRPRLRLIVDQADLDAEGLRPLLGDDAVEVASYRCVRWGTRTGLLLEAA